MTAIEIYDSAVKPSSSAWRERLVLGLTWAGIFSFMGLAWGEPFSARASAAMLAAGRPAWLVHGLFEPAVMLARAVLMVESFGYMYHRFFQHLGWLTRRSEVIRGNQMYHWTHHMILYPIGRFYKRQVEYVSSEKGIAWSWVAPGLLTIPAALATIGPNMKTVLFLGSIALYAKFVIDLTHSRFHETEHPWSGSRYFRWLEDIHLLHHWDQRMNFTIVHPFMDWFFGTYLAPRTHREEIRLSLEDKELTIADLINWRYLLLEATPAEYAAFITRVQRHPAGLRKLGKLTGLLREVCAQRPRDAHAAELLGRAEDLGRVVGALAVPAQPRPRRA